MTELHIHVASDLNLGGAGRNLVAAAFGVVGDLPGLVTTGCGLPVSFRDTSGQPDEVTCLPCREYAHRRYLEYAEQIDRLAATGGLDVPAADLRLAAEASREVARKFMPADDQ